MKVGITPPLGTITGYQTQDWQPLIWSRLMAIGFSRRTIPLHSVRLSKEDVAKIYTKLTAQIEEEADRQISGLVKPSDKTSEQFEADKQGIRKDAFRITVTINGRDGQALYGDDASLFDSPNLPDKISSVYMTNVTAYQGLVKRPPVNSFELNLDFSKPRLLDENIQVSSPTPNQSNLTVQGDRDSWIASISDAVLGVTGARRATRVLIHKAFAYDVGLLILGLPFALYLCWKLSPFITTQLGVIHSFLSISGYIYIVLISVWAYRFLFGYTKWAFPTVELVDNKDASGRHRAFWAAIVTALFAQIVWEIIRHIFPSGPI